MQKLFGVTRWQDSRPNLFLFCKSKHSIFYKCLSSEAWILLNAWSVGVSPQKIQVQIVWEIWWITSNLLLKACIPMVVGSADGFRNNQHWAVQAVCSQGYHQGGVFFWKRCCNLSRTQCLEVAGDEAIRAANCRVLCTLSYGQTRSVSAVGLNSHFSRWQ